METAAPHLLGAMARAHAKAVYAQSRLGRGRIHRPEFFLFRGARVAIGKNKWTTAHARWQRRFRAASARLPASIWQTVEAISP